MFGLPLHAAIVHIPLGVAVVVPVVLAVLLVQLFRHKVTRRSFLLAALLQAVVVGGGLIALSTGKAEEERVEAVVSEAPLERHEDLATIFLGTAGVTLGLLLAAALAPERWTQGIATAGTAASIAVLGLGIAVGHTGGELVYRHGAAAAYSGGPGAPAASPGVWRPSDE
jgi:hypothetical protein